MKLNTARKGALASAIVVFFTLLLCYPLARDEIIHDIFIIILFIIPIIPFMVFAFSIKCPHCGRNPDKRALQWSTYCPHCGEKLS